MKKNIGITFASIFSVAYILGVASGVFVLITRCTDEINAQDRSAKQESIYIPIGKNVEVVQHSNYLLGYYEPSEQAAWVLYELLDSELYGPAKRKDNFRVDPKISTGSATKKDYYKSGYDRGHLAPAADMSFSEQAMSESFFLSNMSPQKPNFNRKVWLRLEKLVRKFATKYHRIIVVTAGVLKNDDIRIGPEDVWVPRHYYKVIYDPKRKLMIAFLLPNEGSKANLSSFIVSVDTVERQTGLDFFPQLPDSLENRIEAQPARAAEWNF